MTTLDKLAASWDEKAVNWRRTAKQQRSACRGGDSTKVRLLEKAQLAEDCARELRAAIDEPANLFDGGMQQDTSSPNAQSNSRINNSGGVLKSDPSKLIGQFLGEVERAASLSQSEAREYTVDSGAVFTPDLGVATTATADAVRVVSDKPGLEQVAWPIEALRAAAGAVPGELVDIRHDRSGRAYINSPDGDRIYVGQPHPGYPAHKGGESE